MDVDDSFTAYVAARWSALFRLAVLLVGSSSADDLTQAALLRAYRSWPAVQAAAAPDAYVRKILVNTAINEGRRRRQTTALSAVAELGRASHESAIVDRDELWSRIGELPPRQRAVIVLRYYEDLSEVEIARVLGCAPGTVKAHAAAAMKTLRVTIRDAQTSGDRDG